MLIIMIPVVLYGFQDNAAQRGYQAYQEGNFEQAESAFREALESDPDNQRLKYNLGNTLAQQGQYEEALEMLGEFKDFTDEPAEQAKAEYNMGNIFSNQEDWENALRHYRNTLKIDPADEDARFNYELAYRNNQQQQQEESPQEQPEESPADSDPAPEGEQEGDRMPDDLPQPGEQQDIPEEDLQEMPDMSPDEANEMLNALDNIEQHLLRDFVEQQIETVEQDEKDW